MADIIRAEVLSKAQILHDSGDVAGAYSVLGMAGDVYADKAWSITNDSPLSIFDGVVALSWVWGAPGMAETKFDSVAVEHQQNYLNIIAMQAFTVGGITFHQLPNSYQIEESYYRALVQNGVPPSAAIDLTLNRYTNGWLSWSWALGLEDSRRSETMFAVPEWEGKCFPASTPIAISLTETRPISDIRVGDTVMAFDPAADLGRGALLPRKVKRLYRNTTEEWVKLTWVEDGEAKELIATPGHHFLDRFGKFPTIEKMVEAGRATVVLASGELTEVTAERITYSAETAHLFERAQVAGMVAGNAALKPAAIDAWQTYNFEPAQQPL